MSPSSNLNEFSYVHPHISAILLKSDSLQSSNLNLLERVGCVIPNFDANSFCVIWHLSITILIFSVVDVIISPSFNQYFTIEIISYAITFWFHSAFCLPDLWQDIGALESTTHLSSCLSPQLILLTLSICGLMKLSMSHCLIR